MMASTRTLDHDHASRHRFDAEANVAAASGARRALWRPLLRSCAFVVVGWLVALGLPAPMDSSAADDQPFTYVPLNLDDASASAIEPTPDRLRLRGHALLERALEVTTADDRATTSTSHVLVPIVDSRWAQGETVRWLLRVSAADVAELRLSPRGSWRVRVEGRVPLRLAQPLRRRGVPIEASARLLVLVPSSERADHAAAPGVSSGTMLGALFTLIGVATFAAAAVRAARVRGDNASASIVEPR